MKIENIRHSLAHILAIAIKELYPKAKLGIGPAIDNGFYYDFALPAEASDEGGINLKKIEKRMKKIIQKDIEFKKTLITKDAAKKLFKGEKYKLELIKELKGKATIYKSGDFIDLCKGPHVKSSKEIPFNSFKLHKIAGAYWKGDEKNKMLTRIYGLAFQNKKELNSYLQFLEEAEKRDHRKLGSLLELFMIDEETGQGLPIWLPNGAVIRRTIEDYLHQELTSQGYKWLYTPHIGNIDLWKKSGHWKLYRESLYSPIKIDEEEYLLRPMNCPFHVKVYNSKIRSYKDLPIKYAELGTVYRYEKSGTLHGLTRVRGFTQDDAHIICTPEQIVDELEKLVKYGLKMLSSFGFEEYEIYLSTRPEKHAGATKGWEKATKALESVLNKLNLKYEVDPGGGVFYGPKIDIKIKDSIGREWQCTTIQFDFNLPERFTMKYINKKGKEAEPFMIHRALLGSLERFFGVLIEHYTGAFPVWLSPVQVYIAPIGEKHLKYAKSIHQELISQGIRAELRDESETISKKIRQGEIQKIPYILIVGDAEKKNKSVSVRKRKKGNIGEIKLDKFLKTIKKDINSKK